MRDAYAIAGHAAVFELELTPAVVQPGRSSIDARVCVGDRQVLDGDREALAATEYHDRALRERILTDHWPAGPISLEYETLVGDAHRSREHPAGYADGVTGEGAIDRRLDGCEVASARAYGESGRVYRTGREQRQHRQASQQASADGRAAQVEAD